MKTPDNKRQKEITDNERIIQNYDYLGKACSVMECTGLIPAAPASEAELEHYEALYPYLPPVISQDEDTHRSKESRQTGN